MCVCVCNLREQFPTERKNRVASSINARKLHVPFDATKVIYVKMHITFYPGCIAKSGHNFGEKRLLTPNTFATVVGGTSVLSRPTGQAE